MGTKLTLRIDEKIIKSAKTYAKKNNTSISKMVSNYLELLTQSEKQSHSISPTIQELSGIIPVNADTSKQITEYHSYLEEKHK